VERLSPDEEAIKAYDSIYRSPLGSKQRMAVRALFMADVHLVAQRVFDG
jgi:hypothetical protein